ncbi:MAG: 5-formyltetrahydrofolate cyclo-ligase [Eubacterium sp.]
MQVKSELRKSFKELRKSIDNKSCADKLICDNLLNSELYSKADTVLFYAALEDEINTDYAMLCALNAGKRIALPRCINSFGEMEFYYIQSLDDLICGHFNVREPDINKCSRVTDFSNSICIVPAVSFDKNGYRLGYGKGYYDRFLKKYTSLSIGLCYNKLITDELPIGEFDVPVNYIISENGLIAVELGGNNG